MNLHALCDIGIAITKELGSSILYSDGYPGQIPLPSTLYKLRLDDNDAEKEDGSDLPECLKDAEMLSHLWHKSSRNGQSFSQDLEELCEQSDDLHGETGLVTGETDISFFQLQLNPSSHAALRKEKAALRAVIIEDDRPADASGGTTEARESEDEALDTPKSRSPKSEGRVPRTRGKGTKKKVQEKASTEHAQVSVSDKLRRSHRLLQGTAECPGLETATVDVTRSTYPVSEGSVLRKRGVISEQQSEMRALPVSGKVNEPDNFGTGDIALKTTKSSSPISEGRVLRKRNVPPDEQASPASKNVNTSKSPRRSSRPSNGVGECVGLEVSETRKVAATIVLSEARVLRKRSIAIDQKVHQPGSIESDDDETMMTWRSRRRKVQ
ncbi:hypothetical protein L7F22_032659 [Adiantum nelumboides]|nr:hypothetical protein [Adiantum nelumboides]